MIKIYARIISLLKTNLASPLFRFPNNLFHQESFEEKLEYALNYIQDFKKSPQKTLNK